jgi:hypothetical protein
MAQLQHNILVTAARTAVPSSPAGQMVEMTIPTNPLYQHLLLTGRI